MTGFLRFVGVVNAAVWFGAAIFFTLGAAPAVFSNDMRQVFGETAFPYYSGAVALVLLKRYFVLQYICGAIALLHLFGEWLYLGRLPTRFALGLLIGLVGLGLLGGVWLQPRMKNLRQTMYFDPNPARREAARHAFGAWHGASMGGNLVIIAGLLVYLLRVSRPGEAGRYNTLTKFRG